MRLDDIEISGFGHFFEQRFGPFESPITVFCGPNEAGKTTLLAFIRAALFGFPRMRERHYPALRGGTHGGVIRFRDDAGRQYELERGERTFALRDGSGQRLEQADLERLLGHASRDMFESVFAFGIGELQQLDLLDKGEAARHIYAAGMGAARLPAAMAALEKGREELWKPSGHLPAISKKLRELEAVDAEIRECAGDSTRFAALQARQAALDGEIEHARAAAADRVAARAALELQQNAWADWSELTEQRKRLAAMPAGRALPDNPVARIEALETSVVKATDERDAAGRRAAGLHSALAREVPDSALLPHSEAVAALTRQLGDAEHSVRDLRTRSGELRQAETRLQADLAALGPGWTSESVAAFDVSFPVRTAIREEEERLKSVGDSLRDARVALAQTERALATVEETRANAETYLASITESSDHGAIEDRREAIRVARARLEAANRAADRAAFVEQNSRASVPTLVAPSEGMRPRTPIGFAVALVVAAGGLALGGAMLLAGLVAGGAVAAVVAFDAVRRRTRRGTVVLAEPSSALADAREAEALAFAELADSAERLGLDHVSAIALDELEDALAEAVRMALACAQAERNAEDATAQCAAARVRRDSAASAVAEAEQAASDAQERWGSWLASAGFPAGLSAGAALDLMTRIEAARQQVAGIEKTRDRIDKMRVNIAAFRALLAPMAEVAGVAIESDESLFPAADLVIKRTSAAERASEARALLQQQANEASEVLAERERWLGMDKRALAALLESVGAADAAAFRAAAQGAAERQKLVARIGDLELALTRLCGPAERIEALDESLRKTTSSQLEQDLADAVAAGRHAADRHVELREERARVGSEITRLDSGERASRLHAQHAELVEELRLLARRWATLTIAQRLLERARDQYQQQRQPAVVANAQEFFTTVTGGRYQRIVAQIGKHSLSVHTADGREKSPADLSRGTQEQLYLALRFGLIRQFNEQATRLPVIVDDILVNFDDERAMRTAQAFVELSRTNQVLVFTCHPSTAALFKAASKSTQVVDLADMRKPQAPRLL